VSLSNDAGQLTATRTYHTIPASGDGSSGTNYDESTFGYDAMGRQNKSVTPGGTISRTVFDARGHAVADYVGTDDSSATDADPTGAEGGPHLVVCVGGASSSSTSSSSSGTPDPNNNMVPVAEREYCDGSSGCSCGGGGSGNLVSETRHVDFLTWHTTDFEYDWRGRQLHVFPPADDAGRTVYTKATYDNLDRATKQERYLEISGSADRLLARSETFYDDRGRVYQTKRYAVDVSDGSVGNALVSNTWFDAAGNAIKQQSAGSQAFTKTVYDSLGRAVKQYVAHDTDETAYADASSVSDDTIVEQVETVYDDAGNVLQTTTRQRFHNATGAGELTSPSGVQPKARVTYAAMYHDEIGRQIAVANYGTYGGATFSRASVVPTRTDTILVTSTDYNDAGQAYKTTDPAAREDRQMFDDAGRVVRTIQNYVDGVVSAAASDEDVTVEMTYNGDGNLETLTAKNPATGDQTTTYVYGTTLSDSELATSTLKRAEIYPDSDDTTALGDGTDGAYDRIEFKYDRQQRVTEVKDQQQTVHAFDFDALGRQTQDRVTALGSGVDGAVRRIATTYDIMGRREKISSYDNPTVGSGSIANEVQFAYDDIGQLVTEYQEHGGAVNTSTSLKVQYAYEDGTDNNVRLTKMTYPDGRELNYSYGSAGSTDDALSRVASLIDNDGSTHLVDYSYLGRKSFVKTDYPEPDLRYDLAMGTGSDPYDGFDRFGRVVDSRWYDYLASADADRLQYGYDRAGNRTYREQTVDANSHHDEVYAHDAVNRLTDFDRGTINAGKDAISTLKSAQAWSLDPTGNWSGFKEDGDGNSAWNLEQSRTSNKVNEITDVTETTGPAWATPAYNRAGNMTTIPKPADPTSSFAATYDAWNRLVNLEEGENTVAEYVYDGAKRRVVKKTYSAGTLDETRHFYYTDPQKWQVIEERLETSGAISADPDRHFVWGLRYIDDLSLRDRDTNANGTLDERLYGLQDANWNVTALADVSGSVQERYSYSTYGTPRLMTATFASRASSNHDAETLYSGYRFDQAASLYVVRHRVYHAELGCWNRRDPIGYRAGDVNLYRYLRNRPTLMTDPTGQLQEGVIYAKDKIDGPHKFTSGDISGELWIDADTNAVPPQASGFVPNLAGVRQAVSVKNYIGALIWAVDAKSGKRCGPNDQGKRVWASAIWNRQRFLRRKDGKDVSIPFPDPIKPKVWYLDEFFGLAGATDAEYIEGLNLAKGAFFDFAGDETPQDQLDMFDRGGLRFFEERGFAVAVLCLCEPDPKRALPAPLAEFYYTMVTERIGSKSAAVSVKPNNSYSGKVNNWLELKRYSGVPIGLTPWS
jgi:RHS repeat-associated protein